jgi:hypothetical protein
LVAHVRAVRLKRQAGRQVHQVGAAHVQHRRDQQRQLRPLGLALLRQATLEFRTEALRDFLDAVHHGFQGPPKAEPLNHTPIPHVNSLPSKLIDGKLVNAGINKKLVPCILWILLNGMELAVTKFSKLTKVSINYTSCLFYSISNSPFNHPVLNYIERFSRLFFGALIFQKTDVRARKKLLWIFSKKKGARVVGEELTLNASA